jgi:hypothetical protein
MPLYTFGRVSITRHPSRWPLHTLSSGQTERTAGRYGVIGRVDILLGAPGLTEEEARVMQAKFAGVSY